MLAINPVGRTSMRVVCATTRILQNITENGTSNLRYIGLKASNKTTWAQGHFSRRVCSISCHSTRSYFCQQGVEREMGPLLRPVDFQNPTTYSTIRTSYTFLRRKSTFIVNKNPSSTLSCLSELRHKTKEWLKIPIGSWTLRDASRGRFLMSEWTDFIYHNRSSSYRQRASQQTKIFCRWIEEIRANNSLRNNIASSHEIVEMLHRCLDSWRKVGGNAKDTNIRTKSRATSGDFTDNVNAAEEALRLIDLLEEVSKEFRDGSIMPNEKSYAMCINILAQYSQFNTTYKSIYKLFERCQNKDLQFYNACLSGLAKCSLYYPETPFLADKIFEDLTASITQKSQTDTLIPNTASFVGLLHAWANSSGMLPDAAARAETILEQMIGSHLDLVNTTCFNIVIAAWSRHGIPEKAEQMLWRMQRLHHEKGHEYSDQFRPNTVTFNSAIHAWAKSHKNASATLNPEKSASRAEFLLEQMVHLGYEPDIETFAMVMQDSSRSSESGPKVQALLERLEDMFQLGDLTAPPSKICYLLAIQAWGGTSTVPSAENALSPSSSSTDVRHVIHESIPAPVMAERLLRRMQEVSTTDISRSDLVPCVVIYTALIDAWAKSELSEAPDQAWRLFQELTEKSLKPNTVTLNVLLKAYCLHDRVDEARELLFNIFDVVQPDLNSYHTILKGYLQSETLYAAEKAQSLVEGLKAAYQREGNATLQPSLYTYSQLLVAWGNSARHDAPFRAEEIFWDICKSHPTMVQSSSVLLNCVLRAWSKSSEGGAAERAEAFLDRVQRMKIQVDPTSHLHLIHCWLRSGRRIAPRLVRKHLEKIQEMCSDGSHTNVVDAAVAAASKIQF